MTSARGTEAILPVAHIMDRTVYGRQQDWEDSPTGWPQGADVRLQARAPSVDRVGRITDHGVRDSDDAHDPRALAAGAGHLRRRHRDRPRHVRDQAAEPADLRRRKHLGHRFVVDSDGQVLGWVVASRVSDRDVYSGVVEHSVYVLPSARGVASAGSFWMSWQLPPRPPGSGRSSPVSSPRTSRACGSTRPPGSRWSASAAVSDGCPMGLWPSSGAMSSSSRDAVRRRGSDLRATCSVGDQRRAVRETSPATLPNEGCRQALIAMTRWIAAT